MKTFLTLAAVVVISGCAAVAGEPVGMRTPNGGYEYYSNHHPNQGRVDTGCILPWRYHSFPVMGYNPKRIDMSEVTDFIDCKIPKATTVVVVRPVPAPAPAPVYEPPAPAPAPVPEPQPAPVRE